MNIHLTPREILEHPNDFALGAYVREKYWKEKELLDSNRDEHFVLEIAEDGTVKSIHNSPTLDELFETCVMCGKLTDTPKNLHIDYRNGYIEGGGQTCPTCFKKI